MNDSEIWSQGWQNRNHHTEESQIEVSNEEIEYEYLQITIFWLNCKPKKKAANK